MLFKRHILEGIAQGKVSVAFRRWKRPTVRAGGSLKTPAGVLRIESVEVIDEAKLTPRAAKQAGFASRNDLLESLKGRAGQLFRIEFTLAGDDPRIALRNQESLSDGEIKQIRSRLARLDGRSKVGAWTTQVLRLIERFPEIRSGELARRSGFEKEWLKLNIRKLKNFGLTESLEVGYRLSPRGRALLNAGLS